MTNGDPSRAGKRLIILIACALGLSIAAYFVYAPRRERPADTPAVPSSLAASTDIVADILMIKSTSEGQASLLKKAISSGAISPEQAKHGVDSYKNFKSALDELIDVLEAELSSDKKTGNTALLETKLMNASARIDSFMGWIKSSSVPLYFDAGNLEKARLGLNDWLKRVNADEAMTAMVRNTLREARLMPWETF